MAGESDPPLHRQLSARHAVRFTSVVRHRLGLSFSGFMYFIHKKLIETKISCSLTSIYILINGFVSSLKETRVYIKTGYRS
jgi:hypothetical protein